MDLLTRRASFLALLALPLAGCGGGGSSGATGDQGAFDTIFLTARSNGTTYPIKVYQPTGTSAERATMQVVYLLDGESRFQTTLDIVRGASSPTILVAIGNEASRSTDYVPVNSCTPGGGGNVAFFDFIRNELIPYIEANFGGDPTRRALLGHSHGGSFVLYAMFAEAPGAQYFSAYLSADASVPCMPATVDGWDAAYAAAYTTLPVRLHLSYAANDDSAFAQRVQDHHYGGLSMVARFYPGGHIGMIPAAFTDAFAFAFPAR